LIGPLSHEQLSSDAHFSPHAIGSELIDVPRKAATDRAAERLAVTHKDAFASADARAREPADYSRNAL